MAHILPASNSGTTASRPVGRILPAAAAYFAHSLVSSHLVSLSTDVLPQQWHLLLDQQQEGIRGDPEEGAQLDVVPPVPHLPSQVGTARRSCLCVGRQGHPKAIQKFIRDKAPLLSAARSVG